MSAAISVCLVSLVWGQPSDEHGALAGRVRDLNQRLGRLESGGSALLAERGAALYELMAADPKEALALALPQNVAERLRGTLSDGANLETRGQWEGVLETVISENPLERRGAIQWYMRTPGGRLEMFFAGQSPAQPGITVRARGIRAGDRIAVEQAVATAAATTMFSTVGPQKIAVLMLTMPSYPTLPENAQATLQQEFFGAGGTVAGMSLNSFWQENSYGLASATGQVFGPFALPQDYTCVNTPTRTRGCCRRRLTRPIPRWISASTNTRR